ncbi:hypothetical protein ACFC1T_08995 [Kitasatospora sp. NPDC056076]|uniref:hypothetical protein n=1 Tax=Kitasatospora sp. NPDC056076 TaxID=3345703 RepID=UPI0035D6FF18
MRTILTAAAAAAALALTIATPAQSWAATAITIGTGTATPAGDIDLTYTYACDTTGTTATFEAIHDGPSGGDTSTGSASGLVCDGDAHDATVTLTHLGAPSSPGEGFLVTAQLVGAGGGAALATDNKRIVVG